MVAVSINSSSLLFDTSAVKAEPEEPKTVYPTLSGGINPLFFGNDGVHHYPRLGRDGETVVATDSHLLNVRPQLASFHGVYDWRWDAEHGDVARSVAAQLSMTHNGPQVVGIDRHGVFKISKLGGRRAGPCRAPPAHLLPQNMQSEQTHRSQGPAQGSQAQDHTNSRHW